MTNLLPAEAVVSDVLDYTRAALASTPTATRDAFEQLQARHQYSDGDPFVYLAASLAMHAAGEREHATADAGA